MGTSGAQSTAGSTSTVPDDASACVCLGDYVDEESVSAPSGAESVQTERIGDAADALQTGQAAPNANGDSDNSEFPLVAVIGAAAGALALCIVIAIVVVVARQSGDEENRDGDYQMAEMGAPVVAAEQGSEYATLPQAALNSTNSSFDLSASGSGACNTQVPSFASFRDEAASSRGGGDYVRYALFVLLCFKFSPI